MTNRQAVMRLASNASDSAARQALYDNNAAIMDSTVSDFFGAEDSPEIRRRLLVRLADCCRLYPQDEDADLWIENRVETETARLYRSEVMRKSAAEA